MMLSQNQPITSGDGSIAHAEQFFRLYDRKRQKKRETLPLTFLFFGPAPSPAPPPPGGREVGNITIQLSPLGK